MSSTAGRTSITLRWRRPSAHVSIRDRNRAHARARTVRLPICPCVTGVQAASNSCQTVGGAAFEVILTYTARGVNKSLTCSNATLSSFDLTPGSIWIHRKDGLVRLEPGRHAVDVELAAE